MWGFSFNNPNSFKRTRKIHLVKNWDTDKKALCGVSRAKSKLGHMGYLPPEDVCKNCQVIFKQKEGKEFTSRND